MEKQNSQEDRKRENEESKTRDYCDLEVVWMVKIIKSGLRTVVSNGLVRAFSRVNEIMNSHCNLSLYTSLCCDIYIAFVFSEFLVLANVLTFADKVV